MNARVSGVIWYAGIGSRRTPAGVLEEMARIGAMAGARGLGLRSGAAPGADQAFERGAIATSAPREIFLPWPGFEGHTDGIVASELSTAAEAERYASTLHLMWHRVSRAAQLLLTRDVFEVLGADLRSPVDFLVCWAPNPVLDAAGRVANCDGGTGLAVRLAYRERIEIVHLGLDGHRARLRRLLAAADGTVGKPGSA